MRAQLLSMALLLIGILSCDSSKPTPTPVAPIAAKPVVRDEQGNELIEPEVVRSKQVQNDNRDVKTVIVGNANGEYVLSCNMKAENCVTPVPGKDYYVFNKTSKWRMPGATKSITLTWIQDWTVSYPNAENLALLPAGGGQPEEMGMYWLDSWTTASAHGK